MPWRTEIEAEIQSRPLVIGLLVDDGVVRVHPPVERVVKDAARKLEAAGHEVIPWSSSGHRECIEIMVGFVRPFGAWSSNLESRINSTPLTAARMFAERSSPVENLLSHTSRLL